MKQRIDKKLGSDKVGLLSYFRNRSEESLREVTEKYGELQHKQRSKAINKKVIDSRNHLVSTILQVAGKQGWRNKELLDCLLMVTYTSYIAMLEFRHRVWPYEYMAFSRRIGELWEPFCNLCFEYPISEIELFVPPLFTDVRDLMAQEITEYIDLLSITQKEKTELKGYYAKVWSLVTSGEIKLELDCHFSDGVHQYNVDFKSGFGSNEKGNTNRLLLVATIYMNLANNFKCMLLVRSEEDRNNHYFQTLKNSGIWEAYCGSEAYDKIHAFTGYDIGRWVRKNILWKEDLEAGFFEHLTSNDLEQYLIW